MNDSRSTVGEQLKSARQAAGLSAEAVGNRLRLDTKYVEALESSEFHELPAPAYTRGYIRAYAQLVNCDPEELIAEYNLKAGTDPELTDVMSVGHEHSSNDPHILWITVGIIGVLLILLSVWGYDYLQSQQLIKPGASAEKTGAVTNAGVEVAPLYSVKAPQNNAATVQESGLEDSMLHPGSGVPEETSETLNASKTVKNETATQDVTPDDTSVDGSAAAVSDNAGDIAGVDNSAASPVPANASQIKQEVTPVAPSGKDILLLSFNGESWTEVYDANGYKLAYGLFNRSRASLTLIGQAPFRVILGNAHMVDVKINSATFAVTPYIRANNSAVVRITAPRGNNN